MADGAIHIPPELVARVASPRRGRRIVGFAGGGGSCIAIRNALGVEPDAALNHWPTALAVHQTNFPAAEHHCADIWDTDPNDVCPGEPVELLWLSPDCRHFSKAKGGAPVSPRVRGLAWVAIPWAVKRRPAVIMLENVEEFLTWGPLLTAADGSQKPDPERKGETFARWKGRLEALGYQVEWRILSAADYGAPTIRKRLFIVARCDGKAIVWPAPTHAPRKVAKAKGLHPYRSAASIIDFSRPCPSIFMTQAEAKAQGLNVKRPLQPATLARIAKGLLRYTIAAADPFIVRVDNSGSKHAGVHDLGEPVRTICSAGGMAFVAPVLTGITHTGQGDRSRSPEDPLPTITAAHRGEIALISPHLVPRYNERSGQEPRCASVEEPYPTVVATNNQGALVAAHLQGLAHGDGAHRGGRRGGELTDPVHTIKAGGGDHALVAAYMEQANTDMVGHDARDPVSTIVQKGCTQRMIAAQLAHMRGSGPGQGDPREPMRALTADGQHAAILETVLDADQDMAVPFSHERELRAFLLKYYGASTEHDCRDPLGTVTSKARFGLVMVAGQAFRIVDIGMRMLDPETELAAAMGVPKGYVLGHTFDGRRVTKTDITKMVGNMVSPPPAEAVIAANLPWAGAPIEQAAACS